MGVPIAALVMYISAALSPGYRPNMASPTVNQGLGCSGLEGDGHQLAVDCKKVLVCRRRPVLPFVGHDVLFCDSVSTTIPDLDALSEWFCEVSTRSSTGLKFSPPTIVPQTVPFTALDAVCPVRAPTNASCALESPLSQCFLEITSRSFKKSPK